MVCGGRGWHRTVFEMLHFKCVSFPLISFISAHCWNCLHPTPPWPSVLWREIKNKPGIPWTHSSRAREVTLGGSGLWKACTWAAQLRVWVDRVLARWALTSFLCTSVLFKWLVVRINWNYINYIHTFRAVPGARQGCIKWWLLESNAYYVPAILVGDNCSVSIVTQGGRCLHLRSRRNSVFWSGSCSWYSNLCLSLKPIALHHTMPSAPGESSWSRVGA